MATRTERQIEETLRRLFTKRALAGERSGCPDDESLAQYLSSSLADSARADLERHFTECSMCMSEVVAAHHAIDVAEDRPPDWLVHRALGLVRPQVNEPASGLIVRLVKNAVELVRGSADWVVPASPQLLAVRGAASAGSGMVQIEKQIGAYKIAVDLEQVEAGTCQMIVTLTTDAGAPAEGFRLSLLAGDREQASFLTREGQAVFAGVPKGDYNLIITRSGETVGTFFIKIEA